MLLAKKSVLMLVLGAALSLNGCYSDQELANASRIITALPEEIKGCVFLGDVDTSGALAMMEQARFELKMKASRLGATHLVETFVYPGVLTRSILGVGLSGRAYKCPEGKGPLTANASAQKQYEIPAYSSFFGDEGPFLR